jgi:hypothetical protein
LNSLLGLLLMLELVQNPEDGSTDGHGGDGEGGSADQSSEQQRNAPFTSVDQQSYKVNFVKLGTRLLLLGLNIVERLGDGGSKDTRQTCANHCLDGGAIRLSVIVDSNVHDSRKNHITGKCGRSTAELDGVANQLADGLFRSSDQCGLGDLDGSIDDRLSGSTDDTGEEELLHHGQMGVVQKVVHL